MSIHISGIFVKNSNSAVMPWIHGALGRKGLTEDMGSFQVRTDLALEARESISEADSTLRGVDGRNLR